MQPWKAPALFQYLDIMIRAYLDFEGQACLRYDGALRMRSAIQPNLRWDELHPGLWLQHMTPAKSNLGDSFNSGHLNWKSRQVQLAHPSAGQVVQPRLLCFQHNARGSCTRRPCKFRHECLACGGQHPNSSCFKAGAQRQDRGAGGPKKQNGGGDNPGKGAQPN